MAISSAVAERCWSGPAGSQLPVEEGMWYPALPGATMAMKQEQNAAGASKEPPAVPRGLGLCGSKSKDGQVFIREPNAL